MPHNERCSLHSNYLDLFAWGLILKTTLTPKLTLCPLASTDTHFLPLKVTHKVQWDVPRDTLLLWDLQTSKAHQLDSLRFLWVVSLQHLDVMKLSWANKQFVSGFIFIYLSEKVRKNLVIPFLKTFHKLLLLRVCEIISVSIMSDNNFIYQ